MNESLNVCLLGASFSTGNLGVSALAWSSIKLIKQKYPRANIYIVGAGRELGSTEIEIDGNIIQIAIFPVRYTPNIFVDNHIIKIYVGIWLSKFIPSLKKYFNSNSTLGVMTHSDLFCDITGGDSFSDIYGFSRFFTAFLLKSASQLAGIFIMLPQTYGPFKSRLCRFLAKVILKKSEVIFSRDSEGIEVIKSLLGESSRVKLCPDVAFILAPVPFHNPLIDQIHNLKKSAQLIVGLNISGLLYYGGYTGQNEFGLTVDYPLLIKSIIQKFVLEGAVVLLVPHVFPNNALMMESDLNACQLIYDSFSNEIQQQVIVSNTILDQSEAKFLIGHCDFFMGARMHSCIAAISQCIPTVAMAYSKKFVGVFDTAGVADCIIDMSKIDNETALNAIDCIYQQRQNIRNKLTLSIPQTKEKVMEAFNSW